jgi:hypothetical protein
MEAPNLEPASEIAEFAIELSWRVSWTIAGWPGVHRKVGKG